jgi:cyclic pyranopterin phosphate synthase
LSRGGGLSEQKQIEHDDEVYFARLEAVLQAVKSLRPSLSLTGGEISIDPRLPRILRVLREHNTKKRVMTTNGSGLLRKSEDGALVLEHVLAGGLSHLNISRAHSDPAINQKLMRFVAPAAEDFLPEVLARLAVAGQVAPRPRLSCVLLQQGVSTFSDVVEYLHWAAALGVNNVIFRQLMQYERSTYRENVITRFNDVAQVPTRPILERIAPSDGRGDSRFQLQKQVLGYYYYVEVYRFDGPAGPIDVCFEGAHLGDLERRKLSEPSDRVHELIFHPNARLCSTWQPWDGVLL